MGEISVCTEQIGDARRVVLQAPYHPECPAWAKEIGGRWDRDLKVWHFDVRDEGRVRELARAVYGTDGAGSTVSVRLRLHGCRMKREFWFAGRLLASRPGRDADVRLGDGVILEDGSWPASGRDAGAGSVANPIIGEPRGVVLLVRDLPEAHSDVEEIKGGDCEFDFGSAEIVDDVAHRRESLVAEYERLHARMLEIEAEVGAENLVPPLEALARYR